MSKLLARISVIPHDQHRYPTVGDWQFTDAELHIRVSSLKEPNFEFLVALHEFVEAYLCRANGVSEHLVDCYDAENKDHPDPGSIPGCPYYREHMLATMIERVIAAELGVDWDVYEMSLEAL